MLKTRGTMKIAKRLDKIPPYLFMQLRQKINRARAEGVDVISLAVGDPVEATPKPVIDELARQAQKPENHRYPTDEEKGMLGFRDSVAQWYMKHYQVEVDPENEVIALIGSKEGCHHFALAVVNQGDQVLMTDPGYPGYRASIFFAGGEPWQVPIMKENDFLPKLEDIPSDVAKKSSAFYLNYPNNPTGAVATRGFFADLVRFAKEYDIAICHDNPYSEIRFDGAEALSFLQAEGAKEVGIELNSLSKPYNMTGWRIGMALGNPELVAAISKVKENTDSGIFNAIQYAGIIALNQCDDNITKMLEIYGRRRKVVVDTFKEKGWDYTPPRGTFYLWIPTPEGVNSIDFATRIFEKTAVVITAGSAYGRFGEGYIRISLTVSDDCLREAMARIKKVL